MLLILCIFLFDIQRTVHRDILLLYHYRRGVPKSGLDGKGAELILLFFESCVNMQTQVDD